MKVDVSRLGSSSRSSRIINNMNVEFNTYGLGRADKIAKKETKLYKANLI